MVIASLRVPDDWRRFAAFACLFALAAFAFIGWMYLQAGGATLTTAVDDIGEAVAAGIAAVSCAMAARRTQGRLRLGWVLLAASAASWSLGQFIWSVYEVGLQIAVPNPSPADIGFIAAIFLAIAGLSSFASAPRGTSTGARLGLDTLIVFLSLLFLGWELGLSQVFADTSAPMEARLVNLAYPIGDILIGTVLLLAIRRATGETQGRLLLLLGGLAANAVSDSTFAYLNLSGTTAYVLDAGWVVGYLMIALAALWPSGVRDRSTETKPIDVWQLAVPWIPILAGGMAAIVLAILGHPLDVFSTVLAGAVIALLMASQVIAHRESLALLIQSRLSAATLNDVIVHAPLGVVRIAPDMRILQANPSFSAILGRPVADMIGEPIGDFFPPEEMALVDDRFRALANREVASTEIETQGSSVDGNAIWLHWTASTVRDPEGEIDYFLVMFEDVSERRSTEDALKAAYAELEGLVTQRTVELRAANERLATEAVSDPLTGLYNRRYLADFVERELSRTRRSANKIVFVMLDVDHFKRVNDTFGHDAGDEVLRAMSTFLRSQIRQEDLAFRYGGEEFLLVLPCTSLEGVAKRVEQIRDQIKSVTIKHRNKPLWPVTLSLGVAVFPDHGDSAEAVIECADNALYDAKEGGRDRIVYYDAAAAPAR
ncbi:MAG TPA: diguanylate cyclase [Candidatus Dormibacteraeota bacterium]